MNIYKSDLKHSPFFENIPWLPGLILLFLFCSCKKFIEVTPPATTVSTGNVYSDDATAAAVLTGIYIDMSSSAFASGGINSTSLYLGLAADELTLFNLSNTRYLDYYRNQLTNVSALNYWTPYYQTIFICNSAIEGLSNANSLTPALKNQLLGEAKFIRAFSYFYLINLYGDVPLPINTNWQINSGLARTAKSSVYDQVITDLKDAQGLLSDGYLKSDAKTLYPSNAERLRPNKWAATALLSRVYLYVGDWKNAVEQSTLVIANSTLYTLLSTLPDVFKKNSKEAIWQLQPVNTAISTNTQEGRLFILPAAGPNTVNYPVYLSTILINNFETGDKRRLSWVDSVKPAAIAYYYPSKYKIGTLTGANQEYSMILRLAEQYLIRAEGRTQLTDFAGAESDLNVIRTRAGLNNTSASDKPSLLAAILHERQVELFTEWSHRWFDLKRTGTIDAVMNSVAPKKAGSWNTNWQWLPIPLSELQKAPQLIQNTGY